MTENRPFAGRFLEESTELISRLDVASIEKAAELLAETRIAGGRLFILGVGGSAANASHAVNDFRKIAGIEAYAPTDNVSELTARVNDEGWATVFDRWLRVSRLRSIDALLVFSVGGGNLEKNISPNLVAALQLAKSTRTRIIGVVGRDGGYTAKVADACVLIPTVNPDHVTPHTEAFQAVVWHLLVSHPLVKVEATKWESLSESAPPLRRAVFLDRDGVLNRARIRDGKPFPPMGLEELEVPADVPKALHNLQKNGFELVVVSNQPDVARGTLSREKVKLINQALASRLPLDDILICYHADEDGCACRKPKPALMLEAARRHHVDLSTSFLVGDRWRDVEAGHNAGCKTILIDNGYCEKPPAHEPDARVRSMQEAADWILRSASKGVT